MSAVILMRATHRYDEDEQPVADPLLINNPEANVAAVFVSQQETNVVIVRLVSGTGFKVRGTFGEIVAKLGIQLPDDHPEVRGDAPQVSVQ